MRNHVIICLLLVFSAIQCKKDCDRPSRCMEKPEAGPCEALIEKYYFDQDKKKCMSFNWGGCDGNVPYDTKEECEECKCNNDND